MRITEIKTTLDGERKTFDCERIHYAPGETVVLYRMPEDLDFEGLLLRAGTRSLGYFHEDRNYNCYHWVDDNGRTLALYFNICDDTRITPQTVAWRDLAVDVLITPDRQCRVLDEDELPDDLDRDLLALINATRDQLCDDPARLLREFQARADRLLERV